VAAIHGEARRLEALHDQLATRLQPDDHLIYLGNVLGRGAAVAATVHELLLFRRAVLARQLDDSAGEIVFLRGSQEELWHKLLQLQFAANPRQVLEWMLARGVGPTIEAYGGSIRDGRSAANRGAFAISQWTNRLRAAMRAVDGHARLMSALRRAAATDDGSLLFVSAGINPARALADQGDAFWWGGRGFETLAAPYAGFRRLVRGLDAARGGVVSGAYTTSIDGGCGFGGPLIAACFAPDGRLIETLEA
jgi:serine/threonine protein phosphatase 1